mmetsp:Transcript_54235/g.115755  ORF Transcript_54235/g.115755 Transcript_54235/m.115755 type:complete len:265 (+) Transcript_54235:127-921(+)
MTRVRIACAHACLVCLIDCRLLRAGGRGDEEHVLLILHTRLHSRPACMQLLSQRQLRPVEVGAAASRVPRLHSLLAEPIVLVMVRDLLLWFVKAPDIVVGDQVDDCDPTARIDVGLHEVVQGFLRLGNVVEGQQRNDEVELPELLHVSGSLHCQATLLCLPIQHIEHTRRNIESSDLLEVGRQLESQETRAGPDVQQTTARLVPGPRTHSLRDICCSVDLLLVIVLVGQRVENSRPSGARCSPKERGRSNTAPHSQSPCQGFCQ